MLDGAAAIPAVLEELLAATGASRVTLRRGASAGYAFPVTDEALAPGAPSLRQERSVNLATQPVARAVLGRQQVVQEDSRNAYDDPEFQEMLRRYGGVAAQIVTPVVANGEVAAILSVHQLAEARRWTDDETAACRRAAERIAELL